MPDPVSPDETTRAPTGTAPAPTAVTAVPAQAPSADTAAQALGRRTLSTAFVRIGPDGALTVELHDGRTLVLRDVVMRSQKYCGTRIADGTAIAVTTPRSRRPDPAAPRSSRRRS